MKNVTNAKWMWTYRSTRSLREEKMFYVRSENSFYAKRNCRLCSQSLLKDLRSSLWVLPINPLPKSCIVFKSGTHLHANYLFCQTRAGFRWDVFYFPLKICSISVDLWASKCFNSGGHDEGFITLHVSTLEDGSIKITLHDDFKETDPPWSKMNQRIVFVFFHASQSFSDDVEMRSM